MNVLKQSHLIMVMIANPNRYKKICNNDDYCPPQFGLDY